MTNGLYTPGHYVPHPGMSDEELLRIAGLTSLSDLSRVGAPAAGDPVPWLAEHRQRPVPNLRSLVPEIPLRPEDQAELDSRLPDIDFVPEGVTDPAERLHRRKFLREKEANRQEAWNREGQYGGQAPGLTPGGSTLLLNWQGTSEKPQPMNLQLSYTIDGASNNVATSQPGATLMTNIAGQGTPNNWDIGLYAKLEWGSGRASHTAVVDFQQGAQIRITGSWVRVTALYLPTNLPTGWPKQPNSMYAGGGGASGPPVTASAILGQGFPTFTTAAARFTRKVKIVNGSSLLFDPIPPFASAFGYSSFSPAPVNLQFKTHTNANDGTTNNVLVWDSAAQLVADNGFPLPMGVQFLDITNNGASPTNVNLMYALML